MAKEEWEAIACKSEIASNQLCYTLFLMNSILLYN